MESEAQHNTTGEHCCEIELRVRYVETDQMGYVHHCQYPVYFEVGRTELLRQNGASYRQMEQAGAFLVVTKLEIRYLAPAKYDDILRLETCTTRLTRARIEHQYRLYRKCDNVLLAQASSTLASVGSSGRITPIPEQFFNNLTACSA